MNIINHGEIGKGGYFKCFYKSASAQLTVRVRPAQGKKLNFLL